MTSWRSAGRLTGLFAKRPVPGRAKTRLAPALGAEGAARLAEAMLADAVERCAAARAFATRLLHAPEDAGPWFRERFPELPDQAPQRGAGLGARLAAFFDDVLAPGSAWTSAAAIGSDAPLLAAAAIEEAHARVERGADVALAPDGGGGYALVALARPLPELFTAVPMSTPDNLERTLALARARGLRVALLPESPDVDVPADLARLRAALARAPRGPDFPRRTAALANPDTEPGSRS